MNDQEYVKSLGSLISNLHSLEYILRAFLAKQNETHEPNVDINKVREGIKVPTNSFTNYDSLGQLINKYNCSIENLYPKNKICKDVVNLRDMIAHGRVASLIPEFPMRLLKFSRPDKQNMVFVEKDILLEKKWFDEKVNEVREEIYKVIDSSKELEQDIIKFL